MFMGNSRTRSTDSVLTTPPNDYDEVLSDGRVVFTESLSIRLFDKARLFKRLLQHLGRK